jgi:hypothetical protein
MVYSGAADAVADRHQLWHLKQMANQLLLGELIGNELDSDTNR